MISLKVKNLQLIFLSLLFLLISCQEKEKEHCNYITDYHQYIYEAEILQ